jgi:hypothetical protein
MRYSLGILATLLLGTALAGCGGSSPSANPGTGKATFTVVWPEPSRLLPAASNSVKVEIMQGPASVGSKVVARPAQGGSATVSFDALPVGALTATATAHPQADGTGTAQAQGTVPLTVNAGQNTAFTLTMASTIDHLEVTPPTVTLSTGQTQQLGMAAKNAAGSIVLVAGGKVQWQTNAVGVASVSSAGLVTTVAPGAARITVTDTESGKSATADITVRAVAPNGPISFGSPLTYSVPAAGDQIVAGDFDGDGNPDVVIGGPQELGVLYGRGDGTLEAYAHIVTWSAGIAARDAADMNNDGRTDIVCTAGPDKIFVILSNGGRTFGTPIQIPVGGGPSVAVAADFNGDGSIDLAVVLPGNGPGGSTAVFLNHGGGSFTAVGSYGNSNIPLGLVAGDINDDGKLDIAVGFNASTVGRSGVQTLINDGTGHFTNGPTLEAGIGGVTPVVGDFTGDSKADVAIDTYWDHTINVWPGLGGLTFGQRSSYAAAPYPLITKGGDVNGDGLMDIVAANAGSAHFSVLRSQGANGFADTLQFDSGGGDTRSIFLIDMNKDGRLDVVAQNQSTSTVSVILNNG